jgi:hypothetical protein
MSFRAGAVRGNLELDVAKFVDALKRATGKVREIDKESKKAEQSSEKLGRGFASSALKVGALVGALVTAVAGFKAFNAIVVEGSKAAAVYETSVRALQVSLALASETDVPRLTKDLEEFAAALQATTTFSDTDVLQVAQTLSILGVSGERLKLATKATLDYSAATGRDAVNSARQFGKTLGGVLGELAEAFPQLKQLSREALINGEAFDFAAKVMGGFAENVAVTTSGALAQLRNQFTDLTKEVGFDVNKVLGAVARLLTESLRSLTTVLRETDKFEKSLDRALSTISSAISKTVLGLLSIRAPIIEMRGAFETVKLGVGATLETIRALADGIVAAIFRAADALARALASGFAAIGLEDFAAQAREIGEGFAEAAVQLEQESARARKTVEDLADEARQVAKNTDAAAARARAMVDEFERGEGPLGGLNDLAGTLRDKMAEAVDEASKLPATLADAGPSLEERIAQLDKILGIERDEKGNIQAIVAEVQKATAATQELGAAAASAGQQFANAAAQASQLGGAAGAFPGFTPTARGGFARGARVGLDFTDPFKAVAEAQRAIAGFGQVSRGPKRAGLANFVLSTSKTFADAVTAQAESVLGAAFADFTSQIINELNRRGVFDPTERARIVSERIAEAERLGLLPARNILQGPSGLTQGGTF